MVWVHVLGNQQFNAPPVSHLQSPSSLDPAARLTGAASFVAMCKELDIGGPGWLDPNNQNYSFLQCGDGSGVGFGFTKQADAVWHGFVSKLGTSKSRVFFSSVTWIAIWLRFKGPIRL